jgi:hypothetical protein
MTISPETKQKLINSIKRIGWYGGLQFVAFAINDVLVNADALSLPTYLVVGLGLVLAQITKAINS